MSVEKAVPRQEAEAEAAVEAEGKEARQEQEEGGRHTRLRSAAQRLEVEGYDQRECLVVMTRTVPPSS